MTGTMTWPPAVTPTSLTPPLEWIVLDIETSEARPEQIEAWVRAVWTPGPWKPETIGRKYVERLADQKAKAALIDQSPIRVVSLKAPSECRVLHDLYQHPPRVEGDALVESFANEKGMMQALAGLLETRTDPTTVLAGHNIKGFDLPKIRRSMIANKIPLPAILVNRDTAVYDTMQTWGRMFSLTGGAFVSLDVVLDALNLPNHKGACDGSKVGELIAAQECDTIIRYSLLDVLAETSVFLAMTGQSGCR